jgi:hypothetical protein
MERLLHRWSTTYYTHPLLIIILIVTLVISINRRCIDFSLKFFPFYTSFLLTVYLSEDLYYFLFSLAERKRIFRLDHFLDHIFTLVELLVFADFFKKIIINEKKQKLIQLVTILFTIFFTCSFILGIEEFRDIKHTSINTVYTVEGIILIFFCSLYYHQLFSELPILKLTTEPSFWISTGLFFFTCCTLPYSLVENYLVRNYELVGINFFSIFLIFYSLLFIMIIKAYLCKPIKNS